MYTCNEHDSYGEIISSRDGRDLEQLKNEIVCELESAMDDDLIDIVPICWVEKNGCWLLDFDCGSFTIQI